MQSELIEYYDGDILLEGCLVQGEDDRPKPLILVAHDWTGRRQYAIDKAQEIAALGYAAFAIDMYGKGVFGADGDVALNTALMAPLAIHCRRLSGCRSDAQRPKLLRPWAMAASALRSVSLKPSPV